MSRLSSRHELLTGRLGSARESAIAGQHGREAQHRAKLRSAGCPERAFSFVVKVIRQADENAKGVITLMVYDMTQQYHAERIKTAAERRRADADLGMMAAEVSRIWQRLTQPARALRRQRMRPVQRAF
jgi:hypothetical protein